MAITRIGTAQDYVASGNLSLAYPAGIQADDVIIVTVSVDGGANPTVTPGGYVAQFQNNGSTDTDTDGYHSHGTFKRKADGNESGNLSSDFGISGEQKAATMQVFRGASYDAIEHMWLPAPGDQVDITNQPFGPITHSGGVSPEMLFYVTATGDGGQHANAPTGFTGNVNANGSSARCGSAYRIVANGETQAAGVYVSSATDRYYTCLLAIPTGLSPPDTPTGFSAEPVALSAHLEWDADPDADSFTVERAATSGGAYSVIATGVTGTSYDDLGLLDGETWWYRIKAVNGGGESGYTSPDSVTIDHQSGADTIFLGSTAIGAGKLKLGSADIGAVHLGSTKIWPLAGGDIPTAVVLTSALNSGDVELSWTVSTNALRYRVYRSTTENGTYSLIADNVEGLAYVDAPGSGTWWYKVAGLGIYGEGPLSNAEGETITIPLPGTPTSVAAVWANPDVTVSWAAPATGGPVDTYTVYRSLSSGSGYSQVASGVAGLSWVDTTLSVADTYYYKVEAVGAGGTGPLSDFASVDVAFAVTGFTHVETVTSANPGAVVTVPSSVQAGDLIMLVAAGGPTTWTMPAGYIECDNAPSFGGNIMVYKIADGTEAGDGLSNNNVTGGDILIIMRPDGQINNVISAQGNYGSGGSVIPKVGTGVRVGLHSVRSGSSSGLSSTLNPNGVTIPQYGGGSNHGVGSYNALPDTNTTNMNASANGSSLSHGLGVVEVE